MSARNIARLSTTPPTRRRRPRKRASAASRQALTRAHRATITTEIREAPEFYYAEEYHQQYLAKNPNGYCGLGGCGVTYG